ncbi:hypothetical protein J6590_048346 [Homalodisca vitripennis]|nr:hypothetical protein J6590_048346 [Homalodisca vitripennis]
MNLQSPHRSKGDCKSCTNIVGRNRSGIKVGTCGRTPRPPDQVLLELGHKPAAHQSVLSTINSPNVLLSLSSRNISWAVDAKDPVTFRAQGPVIATSTRTDYAASATMVPTANAALAWCSLHNNWQQWTTVESEARVCKCAGRGARVVFWQLGVGFGSEGG